MESRLAQAKRKKTRDVSLNTHIQLRVREGALFVFGAVAFYMLMSLLSYHSNDPAWSHSSTSNEVANIGGLVGAWLADVLMYLFGYLALLFPLMIGYSGWLLYRGRTAEHVPLTPGQSALIGFGFVVTLAAGCGLATLHFVMPAEALPVNPGGILGSTMELLLVRPFSFIGATLFLLTLFLAGITLTTGLSWFTLMDQVGALTLHGLSRVRMAYWHVRDTWQGRRARLQRSDAIKEEKTRKQTAKPVTIAPLVKQLKISERVEKERQVPLFKDNPNSTLPPLSLLDPAEPVKHPVSHEALQAISRQVELKLQDFGIEAQVVAVHPGPVITRYELQPAPGVKVSQISNLSKDLARALSAISVRIVDVIPGKTVIGLEIPNENREMVRLSEVLQSEAYDSMASPLTVALGKDISGHPSVVDLVKMPHLLVAGTTGSGKSVAINAMILSMLYSATPKQMRMIMIDPKMLELSIYEGIPHLLAPVVTDMKEAANALRWAVAEMERRYNLMSKLGVRNIANFNRKVQQAIDDGQPIADPTYKPLSLEDIVPTLEPLPMIVIIIDELADMMMVVGKKVEQLIARLAQKARAAGIHLILATQRPSVDVLTGLIKANIPTRIAFQVSSRIDSRTILDQMGAEQLLGHGDMLYLPPGTSVPTRIHGAFVDDPEVHRVVEQLKLSGEPDYIEEVLSGPQHISDEGMVIDPDAVASENVDALYDEAVRIVTETRKASISYVQRRLKIGYNRSARMIEEMESTGVVGPLESNGQREVLAPPPVAVD